MWNLGPNRHQQRWIKQQHPSSVSLSLSERGLPWRVLLMNSLINELPRLTAEQILAEAAVSVSVRSHICMQAWEAEQKNHLTSRERSVALTYRSQENATTAYVMPFISGSFGGECREATKVPNCADYFIFLSYKLEAHLFHPQSEFD